MNQNDIKHYPTACGVYQMFDNQQKILYVGKAKNLRKRLASYFRKTGVTGKTQALVQRIAHIEITITGSEIEALILEHNLIKQSLPPFNILLRDDKTYPYIMISSDKFPRLALFRSHKRPKGNCFGPYPSSHAAREALDILQKAFRVRQCENSYFNNRSRPCLQYQIKRCSAPCVDLIEEQQYQQDVIRSQRFLSGNDSDLMGELIEEMSHEAQHQRYERAAQLRDQISQLRTFLSQQVMELGQGDMDIIGLAQSGNDICVHMLYIRSGRISGSRSHYPKDHLAQSAEQLLEHFIGHYYLMNTQHQVPELILIDRQLPNKNLLAQGIKQTAGRRVSIEKPGKGRRLSWLTMANEAAQQNLSVRQASSQQYRQRLESLLTQIPQLDQIEQMECYDISHTQGELTVASCVVFDQNGPAKALYRKFNIEGITAGDDYAAMEQILRRRFTRLTKENSRLPNLIVIDGGKGQLGKAMDVVEELGLNEIVVLGIAKGPARKSGDEALFIGRSTMPIDMKPTSGGFHLIQHIRDEAHRFAISGHRQQRGKRVGQSVIKQIPGVGAKRRKKLIEHFGGLQSLSQASVADISKVEGISKNLAQSIYQHLHAGS